MPVVDLRFVVHKREDIELATKSLVEFNKVSYLRQTNYDAEAAAAKRGMTATTKLLSLERKLNVQRDIETKLVKEGLMSKKEQTEASDRYDKILAQEKRTLQGYIDTDRVLQKQQRDSAKAEESLGKQRTKTKNETEKLRRTYDSTYAATKRYKQGLLDIDRAFEGMENGPERASRAIKALKSDYQAFISASKSGVIVDAGNQFARYGDQAYRAQQRTKRFASVGLQQAGYQVNDFIVQIASGQNALVAFGQQGSQLAGIFGTGGAVVGAIIAGVAALGNLIYQTYSAQRAIEDLSEAFSDLSSKISDIEGMGGDLESVLKAPMTLARYELAKLLKEMRDIDLKEVREEISQTFGVQSQSKFNKLIWQNVPVVGKVIIQKDGILADMQKELEKLKGTEALARAAAQGKVVQHATNIGQLQKDIDDLATALAAPIKSEQDLITLGYALNKITKGRKGLLQDQVRLFMTSTGILGLMVDQQIEAAEVQAAADKAADEAAEHKKKLAAQMRKANITHLEGEQRAIEAANKKDVAHLNRVYTFNQKIIDQTTASNKREEDYNIAKMKTEGDVKNARDLEIEQAKALAFHRAMSGHEALKLTTAEFNTMQSLAEEAANAAGAAVERKHASEDALTRLQETVAEARELATQIERAANAYQNFLDKTLNLEDSEQVIRRRIEVLDEGRSTQEAAAEGKYLRETLKIQREGADLRKQQDALGKKRTKTEGEITASVAAQLTAQEGVRDATLDEIRLKDKLKASGGGSKEDAGVYEILTKEAQALDWNIKKREALIGLTEEESTLQTIKMQLYDKAKDKIEALDKAGQIRAGNEIMRVAKIIAAEENRVRLLEEANEKQKALVKEQKEAQEALADSIADSMGDAFMSMVDGTKSVKDAFKDMARAIIKELYQVLVVQRLVGSAKEGSRSGIAGAIANSIPSIVNADGNAFSRGNVIPNANGNAMYGGNVIPFANGGAMYGGNVIPFADGGVIGGPTTFPMSAGRTGLMGEDGPEAIMPLKRGANGKLGVQAEGGSSNVVIHQSFNFAANGDESVKKLIAQAAPKIASMTKSSIISDRRRGGQMKATFG